MKKIILALVFFTPFSLFSQKVDLDRYSYDLGSIYHLPTKPLDEDYKTYNVKPNISSVTRDIVGNDFVVDNTFLGGWKKLGINDKAHVTINVNISNTVITKSEVTERVEIQTDKSGKETGRKYFYSVLFKYSVNANYELFDYKGNKINKNSYLYPESSSFTTSEFSTSSQAHSYIKNNEQTLLSNFTTELVNNFIKKMNYSISDSYGLNIVGKSGKLWMMDSKKHPEHDSMQLMAKFMKTEFKKFKCDVLVSEFEETFKPFIDYMKNLPVKYKTEEKNDKKLRYAAYANLAEIYLLFDNPTESIKWADLLINNDYDPKDGESFKKDAENLKKELEVAKISSHHLRFDTSVFEGPK